MIHPLKLKNSDYTINVSQFCKLKLPFYKQNQSELTLFSCPSSCQSGSFDGRILTVWSRQQTNQGHIRNLSTRTLCLLGDSVSLHTLSIHWKYTVIILSTCDLRHDKTNKMSVHPVKNQISLGIRPVWSESSLCTQWVAKDTRFLHVGFVMLRLMHSDSHVLVKQRSNQDLIEPHHEKTCLRGVRPNRTQTGLRNHRS